MNRWALLSLLVLLPACDRGCAEVGTAARRWWGGPSSGDPGALPVPASDCPDGLARCEAGTVSVSVLAAIPSPCRGAASACSCPWEVAAQCPNGCVADDVEMVVDRARAAGQLCAPSAGAPAAAVATPPAPSPQVPPTRLSRTAEDGAGAQPTCDEGDRYRCAGGAITDCGSSQIVGRCIRGCFAEGASIDDDAVSREAAFAMLCSR